MIGVQVWTLALLIMMLSASPPTSAQSATRYVRTSNSTCPGEPCLTINQYASQGRQFLTSNSLFQLDHGDHTLSTDLTLTGLSAVSFRGQPRNGSLTKSRLLCTSGVRVMLTNVRDTELITIELENCTVSLDSSHTITFADVAFSGDSRAGSSVSARASTLRFLHALFANNSCCASRGGALSLSNSHASFQGVVTFQGNEASLEGGALYLADGSSAEFSDSVEFEGNMAGSRGGAIACTGNGNVTFIRTSESTFTTNSAVNGRQPGSGGGGVHLSGCLLTLNGSCGFERNRAAADDADTSSKGGSGGAIRAANGSRVLVSDQSGFIRNVASIGGGLHLEDSSLVMSGNILFLGNIAVGGEGGGVYLGAGSSFALAGRASFLGNMAESSGGGVAVRGAQSASVTGALFLNNRALGASGGGVHLSACPSAIFSNCNFSSNMANISGGGLHADNASVLNLTAPGRLWNNRAGSGGAVGAASGSTVTLMGTLRLEDNAAFRRGAGGAHLVASRLHVVGGRNAFRNNTGFSGAAVHALRGSRVEVRDNASFEGNVALYRGGAIYLSEDSVLSLAGPGVTILRGNRAREGGGVALESGGRVELSSPLSLDMQQNQAEAYGGGMFHADVLTLASCRGSGLPLPPTVETPSCFLELRGSPNDINLNFAENSALIAGSVLYGGGLDRCQTLLHDTMTGLVTKLNNSLSLFSGLSSIQPLDNDTTSLISSEPLDFCFCNESSGKPDCSLEVRDIAAYPGELITLPAITLGQGGSAVPSIVHFSLIGNDAAFPDQQQTQRTGKECVNVEYRIRSSKDLELLTMFPEGNCGSAGSAHRDVSIELLPCPPGFNLFHTTNECVCEERLQSETVSCDIDTLEFTLSEKLWLGYLDDVNSSFSGLLISDECPRSHCAPPPLVTTIADPDIQCLFNRSGMLCGSCVKGHSLTLGSQHCLRCGNAYLALLIPFALAGVLLIVFLFLLDFTVTRGMVGALILYANLVQINSATLLPWRENFLTVFIAWLNLDLGIETCFYEGMDAYAYTWLQFLFPAYLFILIAVIFAVCRCSKKLASFLGSRPTKVLATVVILCYSKFLITATTALSVSELTTNSSRKLVWREDGHLEYFKDYRHGILGVVSLSVLLGCLSFSLLLLTWNMLCFDKSRVPKLDSFMQCHFESFLARKFSWVGFLLLLRLLLALLNIPYSSHVSNTLTTFIALCLALLVYPVLRGELYRKTLDLIIECSLLLNLVMFLGTSLYLGDGEEAQDGQEIATGIFLGLAFVEFLAVLLFLVFFNFVQGTALAARVERAARLERIKETLAGLTQRKMWKLGRAGEEGRSEMLGEDEGAETQTKLVAELETHFAANSHHKGLKEPLLTD